jgi:YidC/Oxa1 family membrane protein insertase
MSNYFILFVNAFPDAQVPIFLSVFTGIRGMTNLPVPSMTDGGFAWVSNLTVPDPFFILPVLTSATMLAALEVNFVLLNKL